jgi:DNA end-binding protein Ku
MWKGSISFGLVNIPVKMYTASQEKEISFKLLHKKDLSEIRYARICKTEGKEVPWEDIVKGYEVEDGEFVVLDDKDFEKINVKKTKTIEIINFVEEDEIDTVYYVKPYYLEPEKNGSKAYALLTEALKKSKKVALAQYVIRNHEHIGVLKFHDNMIVLNELRYATELLEVKELKIPEDIKLSTKEISMAVQLIDQLTDSFAPKKYKDTYTEEVKQVIKQKAKGKKIHPKTEETPSHKIHDIMTLLQQSLEKKPSKKSKSA